MVRAAALIAGLMLAGCSQTPNCENESLALVMAHDFIKRELKSPATAQFPNLADPGVIVTPDADKQMPCEFTVMTHVDSENSFGAMIRTQFIVRLSPDSQQGDTWKKASIVGF